ncbi:MAG TPA: type 1 glutamine amidotransferase domain-containing protein [Candidatus Limnocylindria bacterium]|jgi:protease I|nr:type 1 glutamine amidotransferase domain-containing protein [Candidatus Limnocylindria bacterium]
MQDLVLRGLRVAILATDGVENVELTFPRLALEEAGAEDAHPDDFDAVMLPGGALNADVLRMEMAAREFVQHIDQAGKPIAAICHGPWLLVSAKLVKGRHLTSYYTLQDDIRCAGGEWEDREVLVDRNWVTSRQPSDIPALSREMRSLFAAARGKTEKRAQAPR